ncbi:hypothetical protein ACLKA7_001492 [Drosophila subpalustris]
MKEILIVFIHVSTHQYNLWVDKIWTGCACAEALCLLLMETAAELKFVAHGGLMAATAPRRRNGLTLVV